MPNKSKCDAFVKDVTPYIITLLTKVSHLQGSVPCGTTRHDGRKCGAYQKGIAL